MSLHVHMHAYFSLLSISLALFFYILILLGHFWLYVWKLQPSRKKEGWEIMKKMW